MRLPSSWNVPETISKRLGRQAGYQRLMLADGAMLLILHSPPRKKHEREGCFFFRNPEGKWSSSHAGTGIGAIGSLLDEFNVALGKLDDTFASETRADELFVQLEKAITLTRTTGNLFSVIREARQAMPEEEELINRRSEILLQGLKHSLEFASARQAEAQTRETQKMARAGHRLNILVALFFPIATLATIFGMNFENGMETGYGEMPFFVVLFIGMLLGLLMLPLVRVSSQSKQKIKKHSHPLGESHHK